jgi:hypothetical protein
MLSLFILLASSSQLALPDKVMSDNKAKWQMHAVTDVGIRYDIYTPWQLESSTHPGSVNIYQRIADTDGLMFIRYGQEETLEKFIPKLTDLATKVTTLSDEKRIYGGREARRVKLLAERRSVGVYRRDESGSIAHEHSPEVHTIISATEFANRGVPILVGYRIPEESLGTYQNILDHFLHSVSIEDR